MDDGDARALRAGFSLAFTAAKGLDGKRAKVHLEYVVEQGELINSGGWL
jgi:hypothetical protein